MSEAFVAPDRLVAVRAALQRIVELGARVSDGSYGVTGHQASVRFINASCNLSVFMAKALLEALNFHVEYEDDLTEGCPHTMRITAILNHFPKDL